MTIQQSIPEASDAAPSSETSARVTPMMEQYLEIKAAHPGLLLFYRMGDFYELFFEDAEIASKALGIMLTRRGKHQGMDIPMCGVPVERSDDYLHRLIEAGHRVAVCEQMEDPAAARARGNKSVVRRDVVRLVTPGTLTEDTLLDARTNNYLLAIARARGSSGGDRIGLAWIDISTSEFMVTECAAGELSATLARVNPNEVNNLAKRRGINWFRTHVISKVPFPHPGIMRDVYPGFLQLHGFMSMNLDRHIEAHHNLFLHLVKGDGDSAQKHREFYDEYLAVMDLAAEFYLQTVDTVFIRHALPKGEMTHRGRLVDPRAIKRVALMTVEGENDDISSVGQTEAAHALCVNIPDEHKVHYVQPNVGHYGAFNGSRFQAEIAPRIADFVLSRNGGRNLRAPLLKVVGQR